MTTKLGKELKKRGKFDSSEQEAMLAILRTSDLLENRFSRFLRGYGLSFSQYNVLRILRGEGKPLPCLDIADRMVQVAPAITRVIDQLLAMKMVTKSQSNFDRRVFEIAITKVGLELLAKMDQPVLDAHASFLPAIPKKDLSELIRILEVIRGGIPG